MLLKIFPYEIQAVLKDKIDLNELNEIRLRVNQPIVVNVKGKPYYLASYGLTSKRVDALTASFEMLSGIIYSASEASVYAINNQLKEGFITIKGGYRLGVVGEVVYDENHSNIQTIKNISSINIRVPHYIKNCSKNAFKYLIEDGFLNTLIISPPGVGKTTFLRDIIHQISLNEYALNCLVLDERYEIAGMFDGETQYELGTFVDVMSGVDKKYGFEIGIRSMSPNIIFTDELATIEDIKAIEYASACGVNIVATIHSKNITALKNKPHFTKVVQDKLFDRYVVLSMRNGLGTIEGVYDSSLNLLYRD